MSPGPFCFCSQSDKRDPLPFDRKPEGLGKKMESEFLVSAHRPRGKPVYESAVSSGLPTVVTECGFPKIKPFVPKSVCRCGHCF